MGKGEKKNAMKRKRKKEKMGIDKPGRIKEGKKK